MPETDAGPRAARGRGLSGLSPSGAVELELLVHHAVIVIVIIREG